MKVRKMKVLWMLVAFTMVMNTVYADVTGILVSFNDQNQMFSSGDTVDFTATVTLKGESGLVTTETKGGVVDSPSFSGGSLKVLSVEDGGEDTVFIVEASQVKALVDSSTDRTLIIQITDTKEYLHQINITVPQKVATVNPQPGNSGVLNTGSTEGDAGDGDDGDNTPSNENLIIHNISANYMIDKVYAIRKSSNKYYPSTTYFDGINVTSSSDSSIRQTYYVDTLIRIYDSDLPAGITASHVVPDMVEGKDTEAINMGSFLFTDRDTFFYNDTDLGHVSQVEVVKSSAGYLELIFKGLQYNGNGQVLTFAIDTGSFLATASTTISETIPRGSEVEVPSTPDPEPEPEPEEPKIEVETPYVIVSRYGYGGGQVVAGDTFQLSLTFYNTSRYVDISNMMITVNTPDAFMLTSSSNTFYVSELGKEGSVTKTVQVTAKGNAEPQSHNIDISMQYQYIEPSNNSRISTETHETIAVPVVQIDRFEVSGVEIDNEVFLGDEAYVTVKYVNKGRTDLFNLEAEIEGDFQNPGQLQNIGNVTSGATGELDFYIIPTQGGMLNGEIVLNYEDTNAELKEARIPYSINVIDPYSGDGGIDQGMITPGIDGPLGPGVDVWGPDIEIDQEQGGVNWIAIGCVAGVVTVGTVVFLKKRRAKKLAEMDDEDY